MKKNIDIYRIRKLFLVISFLCSALISLGDSMGNITSLTRNGRQDGGTYGKVNQLTYGYDGNRLVSVSDAVASPTYNGFFGFSDGADQAVEYEYDANGNMTRDRNKGISSIQYNADNLPLRIECADGSRSTYLYTADGTKLQVKYETSYAGLLSSSSASTAIVQTHTIDYVGNKIYEDNVLKKILVDGGYVEYNGGSPVYHAYLTDHQGNVRVVVDENATTKQVNHYYPYGGLMAESTNGSVQRYKYNGKELDRMHGLDWYDHGARYNDAAIGRWHSIDPLCEKYYDVSPYAYCMDNPVNAIDPDGKRVWVYATKLPSETWGNIIPFATHTFVVVQTTNNKIYRFEYGPVGDPLSGISTLRQLYYDKSGDAVNNYMKGIQDNDIKNVIEVNVPNGMTTDAFDNSVINSAKKFSDNTEIKYRIIPIGETEGNCNTSTTSLLKNAGVSDQEIKRIGSKIDGNKTGFGTYKAWTDKERQQAFEKGETKRRMSESLSNHIGY